MFPYLFLHTTLPGFSCAELFFFLQTHVNHYYILYALVLFSFEVKFLIWHIWNQGISVISRNIPKSFKIFLKIQASWHTLCAIFHLYPTDNFSEDILFTFSLLYMYRHSYMYHTVCVCQDESQNESTDTLEGVGVSNGPLCVVHSSDV